MHTNEFTLAAIHGLTFCNKQMVQAAGSGRCMYCERHFNPSELNWLTEPNQEGKGNETAQCPHCSVDCVVPDNMKLTDQQKADFKAFWF